MNTCFGKRLLGRAAVTALVISSVAAASCGKTTDIDTSLLPGRWELVSDNPEAEKTVYTFTDTYCSIAQGITLDEYDYVLKGTELILYPIADGGFPPVVTFRIIRLNEEELTLENEDDQEVVNLKRKNVS